MQQDEQNVSWKLIWKWKTIFLKIKIFLWRLLHKGLPMAMNMHTRMTNIPPICQRCQQENKYEMHCLFCCNTSRQVWFGSPLGIRVHELPMDIVTTVHQIIQRLDEEGNRLFANTLWAIWKERNKTVIEHCTFKPQTVIQKVKVAVTNTLMENSASNTPTINGAHECYEYNAQGWQVIVDTSLNFGGAYVVYGSIHSVGLHFYTVHDAFHAETVILRQAIAYMFDVIGVPADVKVQFYSDCINLVRAVNQGDSSDLPSWRAMNLVNELICQLEMRSNV